MTKIEKIKLLLLLTNVSNQTEELFRKKVESTPIDDLDDEEAQELKDKVLSDFTVNYESFMDEQAAVYDELMSEEAVEASIKFYTSSTGAEIIRIMPEINTRVANLSAKLAKKTMQSFMELIDDNSWRPPAPEDEED